MKPQNKCKNSRWGGSSATEAPIQPTNLITAHPVYSERQLYPLLFTVCHPRHWPDQLRDMKNKAAFLPKPLNFQWFPFRLTVKDCRLPLPLLFQSAVSPRKRETSSPRQLRLGKEFLCLGLWAGGTGTSAGNGALPFQPGWPQPGPLQPFLCLLAWKKESHILHGDPL